LGLAAEDRVALFFGFVRPYKGLDLLIDATAIAASEVPGLRLVVAGEFWVPAGDARDRCRRSGVADRVIIHDRYVPNEEVGTYFSAADVVVLPYREATQSGVVTVAAEYGLPVLATRVGGLPEAVADGTTGLLVDATVAALAEGLRRALVDPPTVEALRHGAAGARRRFDWAQLTELLEDLASDPRLRRHLGGSRGGL
jgi:glycosyltransferase involved in cell wall biosynthesis